VRWRPQLAREGGAVPSTAMPASGRMVCPKHGTVHTIGWIQGNPLPCAKKTVVAPPSRPRCPEVEPATRIWSRAFLMCDAEQTRAAGGVRLTAMTHRHPTIPIALAPGGRLRVLVAEDSTVVRFATRALLLSRWQMDLRMVSDGAEAVQAALQWNFDVVLMDLQMPVLDGYAATRRIRQFEAENPARRRTPVVAFTASPEEAIAARIRESGMDSILTKPAAPHAVCATLHQWGAGKITRVGTAICDRGEAQPAHA